MFDGLDLAQDNGSINSRVCGKTIKFAQIVLSGYICTLMKETTNFTIFEFAITIYILTNTFR